MYCSSVDNLNELSFNDFVLFLFLYPLFWLPDPLPLSGPIQFDFHCSLLSSSVTFPPFPHPSLFFPFSSPLYLLYVCLALIIHFVPSTLPTIISPLTPLHLHPPPFSTTASSSLFHYQISAFVSGLNTWSMSRHSAAACPQTSGSHSRGSLSCSARPLRCYEPGTWVPLSATSSSQSWTTLRPSGVTI